MSICERAWQRENEGEREGGGMCMLGASLVGRSNLDRVCVWTPARQPSMPGWHRKRPTIRGYCSRPQASA